VDFVITAGFVGKRKSHDILSVRAINQYHAQVGIN
jgi:hypothetical protein